MNKEELIKYIKSPDALNQESLELFNEMVQEFPYFQTARLLFLKNAQNVNSASAKLELKKAATFITNREKLFLLLKDVDDHEIEKKEEKIPNTVQKEEEIITKLQHDSDNKKDALSGIISQRLNEISGSGETPEKISEVDLKITKEKSFEHIADTILRKAAAEKISNRNQNEAISKENNSNGDLLVIDDNEIINKDYKAEEDVEIKTEQVVSEKESKELLLLESNEEISSTTHYDKNMNFLFSQKVNVLDLKLPSEIFDEDEESPEEDDLIGKFIENSPTLARNRESDNVFENKDVSIDSVQENEEYLTDTLADIYIKQGYYTKAILAYEKLSLKYPEKNSYFASQIEKIKKFINKS